MRKNNFQDRLDWLIKKFANGKPFVFAKKTGIKSGTFQSYLKGRLPQADQLLCFRRTFGVNLNWLLSGEGEPLESNHPTTTDPEKLDLLRMTHEVLDSQGSYSASLAANIRSFHEAVVTERRLEKLETEVAELRGLVQSMARAATDTERRYDRRSWNERRQVEGVSPTGVERRSGQDRRKGADGHSGAAD